MHAGQCLRVAFTGPSEGRGPLIWGQLAMWMVLRWLPPDDASTNLVGGCEVPPGRTLTDVLDALRALVERHDSLRTRYEVRDGEPVQIVTRSGELPVERHDAGDGDAERLRATVGEALSARPFDLATDLPLRAAVVTRAETPLALVLVLSHLAVDAWSLRIVEDDLRALLDGRALPPRAQQPLERAAYEASAEAVRREQRALDYWARAARELPAAWLEDLRHTGRPELVWAELRSRALALGVRELARANRLTTSMTLQAAIALLLGIYRDEREVAVRLLVATRFRPETELLVGAFNLNALLRLRLEDESFTRYLARARKAALMALATCEYNPTTLEEMVCRIAAERGITADGYCFFNDVRAHTDPDPASLPADLRTEIEAALPATTCREFQQPGEQKGSKFFVYLYELDAVAELTLCLDARFLAPRTAVDFLRDLEWLVVTALATDAGPAELAARLAARAPSRSAAG